MVFISGASSIFWHIHFIVCSSHGVCTIIHPAGGWINIKMPSYQYRKSHCGDKTILWPSCLHNGISYTGKMTSLYWIRALILVYDSHIIQVWFVMIKVTVMLMSHDHNSLSPGKCGCYFRCVNLTEKQQLGELIYWILTHWGLVMPFGDIDLGQHWLR